MDDDRKFEISSAVGTTVFFISCIGIGSYEEAVHEGYESIHEKLPMETVYKQFGHGDCIGYNNMVDCYFCGLSQKGKRKR